MVLRLLSFISCEMTGLDQVYRAWSVSYYFAKKKKMQTTVVLAVETLT